MSEKRDPGLWEGFKAFLMRGNVIDLAVAVVIGAAFTNRISTTTARASRPRAS